MNRRWVCNDVWMDILPFFDHAQLGLKLALLSPRFDVLVDTHFDDKSKFTIWIRVRIRKSVGLNPKQVVLVNDANKQFPLFDRPLPDRIRFKKLSIDYIDHYVVAFLRSNQQIFDKGTNLDLHVFSHGTDAQPIWDAFVRKIWPIFATNIRHFRFLDATYLDNLRRLISPTILSDLNINSIDSGYLFPDVTDDFDGPNATSAGQELSKWLHTPKKDGQLKRLHCYTYLQTPNFEWVNNLKKKFLNATTSAHYKIQLSFFYPMSIAPFELVNERTNEKLILVKTTMSYNRWIIKRCQNGETSVALKWENQNLEHLNKVRIPLDDAKVCIGQLSPPPTEDEEEAGPSSGKRRKKDGQ